MEGGEHAPALTGSAFWSEWDQQTTRSLYGRIISTMPPDSPGSLPESDTINLVAYILQANGLPAGGAAIQNANQLNTRKLVRLK